LDLRSLLDVPILYRLFTRVLGGDYRSTYVQQYVRPKSGDRILDVGCGPGQVLAYLPDVNYLGIDISEKYIKAARKQFGCRGRFIGQALRDVAIDEPGSYHIVMANGLLHHLDDAGALELFRLAKTALGPGGRLVTFDGCYVSGQSALARFLLSIDRGRYVRPADGYIQLADEVFREVKAHVRDDLLRLPYTHLIMECLP
jgi:SAM-dependent methyltransferase